MDYFENALDSVAMNYFKKALDSVVKHYFEQARARRTQGFQGLPGGFQGT